MSTTVPPQESFNAPRSLAKALRVIAVIATVLTLLVVGGYIAQFRGPLSQDTAAWGQFGDYVGGLLNPLFSALALIALLITISLQAGALQISARELELSRRELALTRAELKRSADAQAASQEAFAKQTQIMLRSARVSGIGSLVQGASQQFIANQGSPLGSDSYKMLKQWEKVLEQELNELSDLLGPPGAA